MSLLSDPWQPVGAARPRGRLRSTGFPTPDLSSSRRGRSGGRRSSGNREALPMPRCDPLRASRPLTALSGDQIVRVRFHKAIPPEGDALSGDGHWSGRLPGRPTGHVRKVRFLLLESLGCGAHQNVPAFRGRRSVVAGPVGLAALLSGAPLPGVILAGDRARSSSFTNVARTSVRCVWVPEGPPRPAPPPSHDALLTKRVRVGPLVWL